MYESVALSGQVGRLATHFYPAQLEVPAPAVVLCHGFTSCKENYADLATILQSAGFAVLPYDCRGHGDSEGALDGDAWRDVITVVGYLQSRSDVDRQRIALVGSSMGAHNGLRAAAEHADILTVVAFNTAPSAVLRQGLFSVDFWHMMGSIGGHVRVALPDYLLYTETHEIYDLPAKIAPRPVFLIHARDDELVPYVVSEELRASASVNSRLWLVDQGGHRGPRHDPQVQREVVSWLREWLTPTQDAPPTKVTRE